MSSNGFSDDTYEYENEFIGDSVGPIDSSLIFDEFTFENIMGEECLGRICKNICRTLKARIGINESYICVCVPAYNEDKNDLIKTIMSVMENIDFMKHKIRFNDDEQGKMYHKDFSTLQVAIVPIFDGVRAMDETISEWLRVDFPGLLDDMDAPTAPENVHVRAASADWWYYCSDILELERQTMTSTCESERSLTKRNSSFNRNVPNQNYLRFQLIPIVKKTNHRKHNSHHWFFQGIAAGLDASLVFLTDCGTRYRETCISRLIYALKSRPDLIGVTARQRVETPNIFYHPCEKTMIPCLRGEHSGVGSPPCWKCYFAFYLSPAPLQGYEFEATFVLNSALFNLVEAMPVLPGPCQLLDWQRMRRNNVVEEYFNLLFNEDDDQVNPTSPKRKSNRPKGFLTTGTGRPKSARRTRSQNSLLSRSESDTSSRSETKTESDDIESNNSETSSGLRVNTRKERNGPATAAPVVKPLTFTEFLRVNMRLAEDRVLSFVTVFSTGYGTKWIPGATFFYEPEVNFSTLLTQRRRWINGTVASFLYFFSSTRARQRIYGGFFDSHKAGKSMRLVDILWSLSLVQSFFSLLSPSVFATALYTSLIELDKLADGDGVDVFANFMKPKRAGMVAVVFLLVYILWVIRAFTAKGGKISEGACICVVLFGVIMVLPIYASIIWSFSVSQLYFVHYVILFAVFAPVVVSFFQSITSALLYLKYMPYFMMMSIFFLVFIPSYSYARLWDTTWGNRDTGRDESISKAREATMKTGVMKFNILIIIVNIILTGLFCMVLTSPTIRLVFIILLFTPTLIQIFGSVFYLLLIRPFGEIFNQREVIVHSP